ncbi:hypothetical protein ACQ86F_26275 [Streptomyces venezuelae ATCC 10712]
MVVLPVHLAVVRPRQRQPGLELDDLLARRADAQGDRGLLGLRGGSEDGVAVVGAAVVGAAVGLAAGGAAGRVDALGLAVVRLGEGVGVADGEADVRRGVGDEEVGSGVPEEGDGASDTATFSDALVVTSGTAARSSVSPAPPRRDAARAAVPATATAATAATVTPRLRPRFRSGSSP